MGFPGDSVNKESACNVGDLDSIPGLGRSLGEGNGNPLQYACLENPYGQRSLAGYSPWGRKASDMTEWLSTAYSIMCARWLQLHFYKKKLLEGNKIKCLQVKELWVIFFYLSKMHVIFLYLFQLFKMFACKWNTLFNMTSASMDQPSLLINSSDRGDTVGV